MAKWIRTGAILLAAGMVSAAPVAALAQARAPGATITLGAEGRLTGAESRDHATYEAAMRDFQRGGFPRLERHIDRLTRALDGAPDRYPVIERNQDRIIVRATDPDDAMMLSLISSLPAEGEAPRSISVVTQPNVYPMIALVLGSAAVERQDYPKALAVLDKGLALQPNDRFLLSERITALQGMQRWDEALAAADTALASGDLLISTNPALLHRKRGFSLIELGRLDEAQAAYEESLKTDPENAAAQRQLEYIQQLRQGQPRLAPQFVAPGSSAG